MLAKVYDDVKLPLELAYSSLIVHLNFSVGTQQETSKGAKTVHSTVHSTSHFLILQRAVRNTDNMNITFKMNELFDARQNHK